MAKEDIRQRLRRERAERGDAIRIPNVSVQPKSDKDRFAAFKENGGSGTQQTNAQRQERYAALQRIKKTPEIVDLSERIQEATEAGVTIEVLDISAAPVKGQPNTKLLVTIGTLSFIVPNIGSEEDFQGQISGEDAVPAKYASPTLVGKIKIALELEEAAPVNGTELVFEETDAPAEEAPAEEAPAEEAPAEEAVDLGFDFQQAVKPLKFPGVLAIRNAAATETVDITSVDVSGITAFPKANTLLKINDRFFIAVGRSFSSAEMKVFGGDDMEAVEIAELLSDGIEARLPDAEVA